ncbi:Flagellar sensor histidine kinase FleS [hydrothermal vent metagenome]|uniref:Flagellar sensor histidine kinase FleS n=1 Tax=hydrothermal vent metagenome TaxID=652676 RepID=A0A3B1AIX4_9ZZZZ
MPSQDHSRQQQLADAFLVFNQVSEQLTDSYRELQDQVVRLNGELAAARSETQELQHRVNRQERLSTLGEMAAQLAHQIRTPLASALLDTSHFFREDLSQQRRHQFANRLRDRLRHMEHQIKDMLMFARGNQGTAAVIAISPLLKKLGQMLEPLLKSHHTHIDLIDHTEGQLLVNGNQDALLGALVNLVNNALDHGGDQVQLQVELDLISDSQLQIKVSDNGPGIPKDLLERVFDPFFTTSSGGTGLGLAVVQSVIMAHEGHITIQPSALGGACFQLCLPVYREPCLEVMASVVTNKPGAGAVCLRSLS